MTALDGAGPVSAVTEIEAQKVGTGERREPSSWNSFKPQTRVYDVADPDRHGTILKAGPEVSVVRFDDDQERNIPNVHEKVARAILNILKTMGGNNTALPSTSRSKQTAPSSGEPCAFIARSIRTYCARARKNSSTTLATGRAS